MLLELDSPTGMASNVMFTKSSTVKGGVNVATAKLRWNGLAAGKAMVISHPSAAPPPGEVKWPTAPKPDADMPAGASQGSRELLQAGDQYPAVVLSQTRAAGYLSASRHTKGQLLLVHFM